MNIFECDNIYFYIFGKMDRRIKTKEQHPRNEGIERNISVLNFKIQNPYNLYNNVSKSSGCSHNITTATTTTTTYVTNH